MPSPAAAPAPVLHSSVSSPLTAGRKTSSPLWQLLLEGAFPSRMLGREWRERGGEQDNVALIYLPCQWVNGQEKGPLVKGCRSSREGCLHHRAVGRSSPRNHGAKALAGGLLGKC